VKICWTTDGIYHPQPVCSLNHCDRPAWLPLPRRAAVMTDRPGGSAPRTNRFALANPGLVACPTQPNLTPPHPAGLPAIVWSLSSITAWIHFSHVQLIDRV